MQRKSLWKWSSGDSIILVSYSSSSLVFSHNWGGNQTISLSESVDNFDSILIKASHVANSGVSVLVPGRVRDYGEFPVTGIKTIDLNNVPVVSQSTQTTFDYISVNRIFLGSNRFKTELGGLSLYKINNTQLHLRSWYSYNGGSVSANFAIFEVVGIRYRRP